MSKQEQAEVHVGDLLAWAMLTGNELPMPAEMIATIEAAGGIVDLCDGSITWDAAGDLSAGMRSRRQDGRRPGPAVRWQHERERCNAGGA